MSGRCVKIGTENTAVVRNLIQRGQIVALNVFCEVVVVASLLCIVEFLNAIKSAQMKDTMVLVSVLLVLLSSKISKPK